MSHLRILFCHLPCRYFYISPSCSGSFVSYHLSHHPSISLATRRSGMSLSTQICCAFCKKTETTNQLYPCQWCNVVSYCGPDHQKADRECHKSACLVIKSKQRKIEDIRRKLGTHRNLGTIDSDNHEYTWARFALVEGLLKIRTYAAVKAAHDHIMDLMRLSGAVDSMIRFLLPGR